jgi:hypothetical protein
MNPFDLLESDDARGRIKVEEGGCWRWIAKDFVFFGLRPMDVLYYASSIGTIGTGVALARCPQNDWCVNPWHSKPEKYARTHCRWGHVLNSNGKCRACKTVAQARWRAKVRAR